MRIDTLTLALACASASVAGATLVAQVPATETPQARFRSDADLVQVDVVVVDKRRHPVRGLSAGEFELRVDGQPRPIEAFTEIVLPDTGATATASWTRDVAPDVVTNQSLNREGRIVIIFMDRSIPVGEPTITARRIAASIVQLLGPGDLGAVVSSSGGGVQNLTADRARLLRAVNRSDLSTGMSEEAKEIEERMLKLAGGPENPLLFALNDGRCTCGVCVLNAVTGLADALKNTPRRRKVLFFIGSSLQVQSGRVSTLGYVPGDGGCETALKDARQVMFAALTRANVTVHSLDPAGLVNISPTTRAGSTLRAGEVAKGITDSTQDYLKNQNSLGVLPELTGGRVIVNTNAPADFVPEIFRENDAYYLVGFRASADGKAPGLHKIDVTVKRGDLRVHARNGYDVSVPVERSAADGAVPESLRSALEPLLPAATFPIDAQAAAFAVPGSTRSAVVLVVGLDAIVGSERNASDAPFDLVSLAIDPAGRSKALARSSLALSLARETGPRQHVDVFSGFELKAGDYEIRVAGGDGAQNGSVFTHATVPSFASEALSLSSILFGEIPSPNATRREIVGGLTFPLVPTARREFQAPRRVHAFVRIYQGTGRSDAVQPVTLHTFLIDGAGQTVSSGSNVLAETQFNKDRATDHLVALPISTLPPGDYLLRLQATMGKRSVERMARFTVGTR